MESECALDSLFVAFSCAEPVSTLAENAPEGDVMTIDAVELARKLVAFPSTNPPGEEKACADFVAQLLAEQGFAVERYEFAPGRPSLVAKTGGTSGLKPLCFTGHLDVVPVGNSPWRHPPFAAVVEDGKLHGR